MIGIRFYQASDTPVVVGVGYREVALYVGFIG